MNSSLIMCILKILTDLCLIRLKTRIRNIFLSVVSSVYVCKVYADFECILKNVKGDIIGCDSNSSYSRKYQYHIPCSFAYKFVLC